MFVRKRRLTILRNIQLHDQTVVAHDKNFHGSEMKMFSPNCFPVRFDSNLNFIGDPLCTIDISGFREGDMVIITPCYHIFHPGCIMEWVTANTLEKRCPNCNFNLAQIKFYLK